MADVQKSGDGQQEPNYRTINGETDPSGRTAAALPDVLSGQEVQQLRHVSGPLAKLHRELADPVVQNQSSVHALSDQRQLHVGTAHHHSHPGGGEGG